jgi:hypothetical protein
MNKTGTISLEEYRALIKDTPVKSKSKYKNVITVTDGIKFHSKKESQRYLELKMLQRAGKISSLARQVGFSLRVNDQLIANYISDFCYIEDGKYIVEDVKSDVTRNLSTYILKKNLMKAIHGIKILET